ncbi:MAG: hypothetical protein ACXV5S_06390, partial [Acidimicrobiales bacterium]
MRVWWNRSVSAISEDLAVHGLAYLGVLLVFAGVFGFVAFAFADVQVSLRPVAEAAIPLTFFLASWMLRRRGIHFVSSALELLGGALLPVVVVASLSDGFEVPPDLEGSALVAALVTAMLVLAGAYAVITWRRLTSSLRYLVAPVAWMAVVAAGLLFAESVPAGEALSHPVPGQWALVSVAVAATIWVCRGVADEATGALATLRRATLVSAVPGVALAALLAFLAAGFEGWPAAPVLVVGLATMLSLEGLAHRFDARLVCAGQALTLYATAGALSPSSGLAWAGAVAVVGSVAMLEWQRYRRPTVDPVIVLAIWLPGVVVGLLGALVQPVPSVVAWSATWLWAVGRRVWPRLVVPGWLLVVAIVGLPFGVGAGLAQATSPATALVVMAAVVVTCGAVVRVTASDDELWAWWIPGAAAAVLLFVATASQGRETVTVSPTDLRRLALASALTAVAFAIAPRWPVLRVWSSAVAAAATYALVADASSWSAQTSTLVAAGVGIVLVGVAAGLPPSRRGSGLAGHVGAIGHLVGTPALLYDPRPRHGTSAAQVAVLASCFVGWAVTTTMQETTGSSVVELFRRLALATLPPPPLESTITTVGAPSAERPSAAAIVRAVVALPGIIATVLFVALVPSVLDSLDLSAVESRWLAVSAVGAAVAAVALARLVVTNHRRLAGTMANTAFVLGVATWPLSMGDDVAATIGAGLIIVAAAIVGATLRRAYMLWIAWLASAVGLGFLAHRSGVGARELRYVVLGWGAAALIGGLALDDRWEGRRGLGQGVRRTSLLPPVLLGALAATGGFVLSFEQNPWRFGWSSAFAAVVVLVVAWQLRWAVLSGLSWLLATVAFAALAPWEPLTEPWTFVPLVALMVLVSELVRSAVGSTRPDSIGPVEPDGVALWTWVGRWDWPSLVAGHLVAVVALVAALDQGSVPATWCSIGAIAILFDVRRRVGAWAAVGTGLVLVGAGYAGWGWLSLALAVTAVATGVLALRVDVRWRPTLQIACVAAAAGSFASALAWREADLQAAALSTAVAVAVFAVLLAVAMRGRRIDDGWVITWACLVPIGIGYAAVVLARPEIEPSPLGQVLALAVALAALPTALAARRFEVPAFRSGAAVVLAAAGWPLAYGTGATPTAITLAAGGAALVASIVAAVLRLERLRAWRSWLPPALLLAGIGLATASIAGAVAGAGWLALALVEVAVLTTVAGVVATGTARLAFGATGVAASVGAWVAFADWVGWNLEAQVVATALGVTGLSLLLGVLVRVPRLDRNLIGLWAAPVVAGLAFGALSLQSPLVERWPAGGAVALAFAAAAVALVLAATPLGREGIREAAAVMMMAAGGILAYATAATSVQVVVATAMVGTIASLAAAAIEGSGDDQLGILRPWDRPMLAVAGLTAATSVAVASDLLPARPMLVVALLLLGIDLAALGLAGRFPALLTVSPVPLGVAWLVFASEALTGNAQWFTVPVGCTLLTVVGLARWQRRRAGLDPMTPSIVVLDVLGCLLVVSAALIQIVVDNIAYGLLAVLLGALVAGWGVLTRVRRRLVLGAATIALAVALMILVPLIGLIPQGGSPALWLTVVAAGLIAIV